MRNDYSTPTVSFADRSDYRRQQRRSYKAEQISLTYTSEHHRAYASKRGFIVDYSTVQLMNSWLRGKL